MSKKIYYLIVFYSVSFVLAAIIPLVREYLASICQAVMTVGTAHAMAGETAIFTVAVIIMATHWMALVSILLGMGWICYQVVPIRRD